MSTLFIAARIIILGGDVVFVAATFIFGVVVFVVVGRQLLITRVQLERGAGLPLLLCL